MTFCPTVADTVLTGQTRAALVFEFVPLVVPPVPEVVLAELTMSGFTPNLSP